MQGHVAKKKNRWYPVIYIGINENGKKKYKWGSGSDTKREAQRLLNEMLVQLHNGIPDVSDELLSTYLLEWLQDKQEQIRHGTFRSYKWLIEKHIIPNIGQIPLSELKAVHLQRLYAKLRGPEIGLSSQSVLNAHRVLVQALGRAVKWDMLHKNVAVSATPPRPQKTEMQVWDEAELRQFLQFTEKSTYYIAFVLLSSTSMRLGELLALEWKNVDLDAGIIRVVRSYSYTGKGYKMQELKTRSGRRSISIPPSVIKELQ